MDTRKLSLPLLFLNYFFNAHSGLDMGLRAVAAVFTPPNVPHASVTQRLLHLEMWRLLLYYMEKL